MLAVKDIVNKIDIIYDGVELNKIKPLKEHSDFLCDVITSEEKHSTAITLHTGSIFYQAITLSVAVLSCLIYHNTDNSEFLEYLKPGNLFIISGKRYKYIGIKNRCDLGKENKDFFVFEGKDKEQRSIPVDTINPSDIIPYYGTSSTLGGKGVKNKKLTKSRKDFLSTFINDKSQTDVSTIIKHSIAVVLDREKAELLYKGIDFRYNNNKVALSNLVTASYYSDEQEYQIGNNPTKEEPIIKFYSKLSVCRDAIVDDRKKRTIGCLICEKESWVKNCEAIDITERKGLKFVFLAGKTHYTDYVDWYNLDNYKYNAIVPETASDYINDNEGYTPKTQSLKKEFQSFSMRNISDVHVKFDITQDIVFEIKKMILIIKQRNMDYDDKTDEFIISSYFLLSLCRSAFFPLIYCDKASQERLINWTINEKLEVIKDYVDSLLIGELKNAAQFVYDNISQMISTLYYFNPKGEAVKERICNGDIFSIVVGKAYYKDLFELWMDDCKISNRPQILTISAFEKSKCIYNKIIFSTAYSDLLFNPYASFNYISAEIMLYDYELYQSRNLKKTSEKGRQLLHENNSTYYDLVVYNQEESVLELEEDEKFEYEMDKLTKDLLLKNVCRYIPSSNNYTDGMVKIKKIFIFDSGNVGYFTKYYKGYKVCKKEVMEVDLDELKVGDTMVFTKQNENKDIVDLLLNKLLKEQLKDGEYPEYYRLSICWKKALRDYLKVYDITYKELSDRLKSLNCEKHETTIRSWLDPESHIVGPRNIEDYNALVELTNLNENPIEIQKGCEEIRSLRRNILDLLGRKIRDDMFTESKNPISELIFKEAKDLTLIESIANIIDSNKNVPVYMTNKSCNIRG